MRMIFTSSEIFFSGVLVIIGLYLLDLGFSGSPKDSIMSLLAGAVLFGLGCVALSFAIRSRLWHRAMTRESLGR